MHLRESRVLRKIRNGEVALCTKLNLSDPRNAEIAALCGFDCIWPDFEHVPNGIHDLENIVRAAKIYDVDVLTRVRKGSYSDFINPFEADSTGIMVPHLMSAKEAKEIVYFTKFHPIGRRPLDGGNADGKYCMVDGKDYMQEANRERFVVVQIEDPEPLKEIDEICSMEGIDMIFFGPADFTQGIGKPCDFNAPELSEARAIVAKKAREYGKIAGTVGSLANKDMLIELGYNFISIGADVIALSSYYKNIVENFKK